MKATTRFLEWSLVLVGSAALFSCVEAGDTVVDPAEVNSADDDEDDEPVRRNTLEPNEEDECGDVSAEGQCDGEILERCVDGEVETVDCSETDTSCGISEEGEAACLSCDEVNDIGFCVGDIATFCEDGVVSSVDCAARSQVCGRPEAYATCVDEDTPSNCDAISSAGACNGDELIQCTDGELEFVDCTESGDGYSCGMHEDGYAACLSCEEVDATGFCVGDIYSYCEDGEVRTGDCSATGEVCQATDEGFRCGDPEAAPEPEPQPDAGDQCAAESDCGGCCEDAHPAGLAQYSAEVTRCSCVVCADECEEICVDGASSASDTCVSCASQCVSDGSCLGDEDCAGYLACLASCPAAAEPAPEPEPEPESTGSIGAACGGSDECDAELSCNVAEDGYFGGGYPNGLCTLACAEDPFACPTGTQCVGSDTEAYCAPECATGDVSGVKCRQDQVCVAPSDETLGVCDAWCREDDDCPGQVCDIWTGLCASAASTGKDVGAACTTDAECAGGLCLFWADAATSGVCSSACRLSETPSPCNTGGGSGVCDPVTTMLGFGLAASPGAGDLGLCAPGCESDEDCLAEGLVCVALRDEFQDPAGTTGICEWEEAAANLE